MVVSHGHLWIVVQNDANLPQGGRESSAWADTNLLQI